MRFSNPQKTRYRKNLNTQTHKNGHIRKRIPQLRIVRIMHKFAAAKQSKRPKITAEIKFRTGTLAQKDNFPRTHTSTIHMYIHYICTRAFTHMGMWRLRVLCAIPAAVLSLSAFARGSLSIAHELNLSTRRQP